MPISTDPFVETYSEPACDGTKLNRNSSPVSNVSRPVASVIFRHAFSQWSGSKSRPAQILSLLRRQASAVASSWVCFTKVKEPQRIPPRTVTNKTVAANRTLAERHHPSTDLNFRQALRQLISEITPLDWRFFASYERALTIALSARCGKPPLKHGLES